LPARRRCGGSAGKYFQAAFQTDVRLGARSACPKWRRKLIRWDINRMEKNPVKTDLLKEERIAVATGFV